MSQETIREPDSLDETIKRPQAILKILQVVHQETGQNWKTLNSRERDKAPCLPFKKHQAAYFSSIIQKTKVHGTHTPCKNKHLKC